jgi:hypothetical protein
MDEVLQLLGKVNIKQHATASVFQRAGLMKSQEDLDYALSLRILLLSITDADIRVESPWISIYTNNLAAVDSLANLDNNRVKYISKPDKNNKLSADTIIMPKMNFEFRVTLGKTTHENSAFVQWLEGNKKCRLTKSAKKDLLKTNSWGGKHFYITGDNNLLMAKMHLGGSISKVERIIKA